MDTTTLTARQRQMMQGWEPNAQRAQALVYALGEDEFRPDLTATPAIRTPRAETDAERTRRIMREELRVAAAEAGITVQALCRRRQATRRRARHAQRARTSSPHESAIGEGSY
jgi:hypothetical protein